MEMGMGWGFGDREYLQMTKFELSVETGEDGNKIGAGAENGLWLEMS